MDRENFLKLDLEEQINYFNKNIKEGLSISKVAKNIGVSKSITEKFKKYGYILKENGYVKEQNSITDKKLKKTEKTNFISSDKEIKKDNDIISKKEKRVGRPKRKITGEKHTIIIDPELWKDLRIHALKFTTTASEIIESLVDDFLKDLE